MDPIIERCCGLDVHQATVVACVLVGGAHQKPRKEVRSFGTKTRELMALREWLTGFEVTHVGMEATGIYWKPVYAVLEDDFELVVGNAHHIKNVPGRKTDVKDSEWIADLLRHGLIAKSFVPPKPIRELVFKSAAHLAAWAGVCPGNNESAGKRKAGTARKGNVHLMTALVEAAHAASRKKDTYFKDKFFRLKARRGYLRAAVAIAHKILKAVHVMLSTGTDYRELGAAYLDASDARRVAGNLIRRLERLGYDVTLTPRPPEPAIAQE